MLHLILLALVIVSLTSGPLAYADEPAKPNIIYILADDLGYGDVACLNPDGKIKTPHMDRLAREGMIFTDAHSGSSVCTPTRYGILTGRYSWRILPRSVLFGYSPPLIPPRRMTVASMLKQQGYATACIGKWHLGLNWPAKDAQAEKGKKAFVSGRRSGWKVDYTKPIQGGPTELGFDTFFGISASLDMPPYVYIRDEKAESVPTVEKKWIRAGPASEDFEAIDVLPRLTEEAVKFIDAHAEAAKSGKPFFVYLPLASPHTPIVPTDAWKGRSQINAYADFTMQTDASVGAVLAALDKHALAENTIVIFTSDNGCSPQANFKQLAEHGHDPSYTFRGHKADIYDGGHRIPFLVRWPARVKPRTTSDQTICLTDLMATAAEVLNINLPDNAGEDSVSILPALLGEANKPLREATVHHSINGSFAIRQDKWKLVLCPGSGGWSAPRPGKAPKGAPSVQLFDIDVDVAEQNNVQAEHPEVVSRLTALLQGYVDHGRSTPGKPQKNDRRTIEIQ